ncbi:MAG: bifunctional DNA primase/polymerase [Symploca sp. SIO2E9]|nr:bifunctional DNA primase/polymerase [Symploca sp. SIO2E9]
MKQPQPWNIFSPVPNAASIAAGLKLIPSHWSLTPLADKSPTRKNWQSEPKIPHETIAELILHGERRISKKGNPYTAYYSGFGVRTGDYSDGLLAVDIDGASAEPLLEAILCDKIPHTVSWTSNKTGRKQLAIQIPEHYREPLQDFTRAVVTEYNGLRTLHDEDGKPIELLEFRYNRCQSALPPSRHPQTGQYNFSNTPADTLVIIASERLCQFLIQQNAKVLKKSQQEQEEAIRRTKELLQRRAQYQNSGVTNNIIDFYEFEILPRLTAEKIFCWNGHNFRSYGKTLKGAPPWRHSASGTSFHVWDTGDHWAWQDKATGEGGGAIQYRWKLKGGSGTPRGTDFVEIVKELAADVGLSLPEPQSLYQSGFEPDPQQYLEYLKQETLVEETIELEEAFIKAADKERQAELKELFVENDIQAKASHWIKNQLKKLKRLTNWQKSQQGQPSAPEKTPLPSRGWVIKYEPNKPLPTPSELAGIEPPKIVFSPGQRKEVRAKLIALGWQFSYDKSFTGAGKSHDAGLTEPDPDSIGKIWYWDSNHRNCSTATVASNYTDMVVRHDGLVAVPGRTNALGEPHLKYASTPDEKELAIEPSNCFQADTFIKLREKGYTIEPSGLNPLCQNCPFNRGDSDDGYNCAKNSGMGFGYRHQRAMVMEQHLIRANLSSAPEPAVISTRDASPKKPNTKHTYDYSHDTCFVEEASRTLKGIETITAIDKDLAQLWLEVEQGDETIYQALAEFRAYLFSALNGEIENFHPRYGASHWAFMDDAPTPPENIEYLIKRLKERILLKLEDIFVEPESVTGLGGKWRSLGNFARAHFKQEARHQTAEYIDNLPPNILIHALEIWASLKPGAIRVNRHRLTLTIGNQRPGEVLRAHKHVTLMDATADKVQLAAHLGVDPNSIIEMEQERPAINNLTVCNVTVEGMGSNTFSDTCKQRQVACLEALKEKYGEDLAVLGLKDNDYIEIDGHWFYDNRGTNAFVGKKAIAAFGKPMANVGALKDEYLTLHGTAEGFDDYYQSTILAEIEQLIGRQRPHLDPDNQYVIYIFNKGLELDYLADYGIQVKKLDAFNLAPEAGTETEILLWKLQQAYQYLIDHGEKIIQTKLAAIAEVTQGRLSQFAQKYGGWKGLKKILASLLESYRDANNWEPPSDDELALANDGLKPLLDGEPSKAVTFVADMRRILGLDITLRVLRCLSLPLQAKLLGLFLAHFPEEVLPGEVSTSGVNIEGT